MELLTPPPGAFSRRSFLRLAGGGAVMAGAGSLLTSTSLAAELAVGGDFNLFTWAGYDGAQTLKAWYADKGIKLKLKAITNEDIAAVIKGPGGSKWDASSVNQGDSQYYAALGVASPVTVKEVPGLGQMYPFFRSSPFWQITSGTYNSVPWTWGPLGVSYRPDKLKPADIQSWHDLTKPAFKGRLGTFDSALNMVSIGAVAVGADPGKLTKKQLDGPVKAYLEALRPNLKVLSTSLGDQVNTLVSGDVDAQLVGLTWFNNEGAKQGKKLAFLVPPKEGSFGFVDAVFIPPSSKHRENAIAYANALMGGSTAIAMANSLNQLSTVPSVNKAVKASVRAGYPKDLATYVQKTLKWNRSYYKPGGPYATIQEWTRLWEEVKAA